MTQVCCSQSPCSRGRPLLSRAFAGDAQTLKGTSGSVSCGFPRSWCAQGLFEPSEHFWTVWSLILNVILSFLLSYWGFSFAVGHGVSFFGRIQYSPVNGCTVVICNFGVFTGDECISFYSAILNRLQKSF